MATKTINNIKLGVFVITGLSFLIIMLYLLGKNQNLFGSTFTIKARFENVQGMKKGNNVRYAGIDVGTVSAVEIINDTLVEVSMLVQEKMKGFIRNDAVASIGSDGLVGNKVINITASGMQAPLVKENDILPSRKIIDTDAMLRTLEKTNDDIGLVAGNLNATIQKLNTSTALWKVLNDETLPLSLRASFNNVESATAKANGFIATLNLLVGDVKNGKGSLGAILKDTAIAQTLEEALLKIKMAGDEADSLGRQLNGLVSKIDNKVNHGKGIVNTLLNDSAIVGKVHTSLSNIEEATDSFNQSMEALKHNFLLRGYFRKQERQKKRDETKK